MSLLAVYGTLRAGAAIATTPRLAGRAQPLGTCRIPGSLIDLGRYPTLRADASRPGVVGELLRLIDPALLDELDRYESFDSQRVERSPFVRRRIQLFEPSIEAWVYVEGVRRAGTPVAGNDWVAWLASDRGRRV